MSESVTWKMENHTKAKHEILRKYLAAWFPILSRFSKRILYIDGFAGPGIYKGGEYGSPVIAIRTATEHILKHRFNEIVFLFIEKDKERSEKLTEVLLSEFPTLPNENIKYFTTIKVALQPIQKHSQKHLGHLYHKHNVFEFDK